VKAVIRRLRAFAAFWYDFVIGDDWRVALGVAVALAVTWALSRATRAPTWWVAPVAVIVLLPLSIHLATRRRR